MPLSSDESIHLEPILVRTLRLLACIFCLAMAALLVLTASTGIGGNVPYPAISYACALTLTIIGILHVVWDPFSIRKVAFYYTVLTLVAAVSSAFSFGFEASPIYLAWTTLFLAAYIFFGIRAAYIYIAFLASGLLWLTLNLSRLNIEHITVLIFSLLTEGFMLVALIYVWRLADDRLRRLEESRKVEQFEHRRLAELINSMLDAVVAVDEMGVIQLYNAATLSLFDTNRNLQGSSVNELLSIVDSQNIRIDIMALAHQSHTKKTTYTNFSHIFSDGDTMALSIKVAPISPNFPEKGQGGFVFIFSDITKAKSLEEEREEFISVVSHELRTPIAIAEGAIGNTVLMLQKGEKNEQATKNLNDAHDQVVYLARMINDISVISQAEQDEELEQETINVDEFMHGLYQQYSPQAKNAGLTLDLDIIGVVGEIATNRPYLEQILQNLITNGIKYTSQGSVTLHTKRVEGGIYFAVSDTGHGISKSDQRKVFQKFYRSEDYRTRETSGTGLGLYVAVKLSDKLGAHINLESRLNHGSTFSFVLPVLKLGVK